MRCDFLCIHQFNDGNRRMSRLLTLRMLYQSGYYIGKYISIEKQIEKTKDRYYDALEEADAGWYEKEMIQRRSSGICRQRGCRQEYILLPKGKAGTHYDQKICHWIAH